MRDQREVLIKRAHRIGLTSGVVATAIAFFDVFSVFSHSWPQIRHALYIPFLFFTYGLVSLDVYERNLKNGGELRFRPIMLIKRGWTKV